MEKLNVKENSPPIGYNPIAEIRGAMFHWICVPFNSHVVGSNPIWCYVTCLNAIQIESCGDISCLSFSEEDKTTEQTLEDLVKIKNAQEALVKKTLIKPSFDEIITMITQTNFLIADKKREKEEIEKLIETLPDKKQVKELKKELVKLEFYLGFLLPDDMMNFLTAWAMGIQITDIKKLSRDILLKAAIRAKNGNDNPHDHISGVFTDFQMNDIDNHAWIIYNQFLEDQKTEKDLKNNKYNWIVGGRKK